MLANLCDVYLDVHEYLKKNCPLTFHEGIFGSITNIESPCEGIFHVKSQLIFLVF